MVICLEQGADLHMAQPMPLPLIVSCFSKIQIGFTFLVAADPDGPGKGPLNGCVCVLDWFYFSGTSTHNYQCDKRGLLWQITDSRCVLRCRQHVLD